MSNSQQFSRIKHIVMLLVVVGFAAVAKTFESAEKGGQVLDGNFVFDLGTEFNNSLLRLLGTVIKNVEATVNKNLTDMLCRYHPCKEWGAWSDCPAPPMEYSMAKRFRDCNLTSFNCTFDHPTHYATNETKVCHSSYCPHHYNITGGFCLKYIAIAQNQTMATQSCQQDGGDLVNMDSQTKTDAVYALLKSYVNYGLSVPIWINIWINGKRANNTSPYENTYNTNSTYSNWMQIEPTNGTDQLCRSAQFGSTDTENKLQWHADICTDRGTKYVCEVLQ